MSQEGFFLLTQLNWSPRADRSKVSEPFYCRTQTVGTIHVLRVQFYFTVNSCYRSLCTCSLAPLPFGDGGMMDCKSVPQLEPITVGGQTASPPDVRPPPRSVIQAETSRTQISERTLKYRLSRTATPLPAAFNFLRRSFRNVRQPSLVSCPYPRVSAVHRVESSLLRGPCY